MTDQRRTTPQHASRSARLRGPVAIGLAGVLLGTLVFSTACYRRVISSGSSYSRPERVYEPNAPAPGTPFMPWLFGGETPKDTTAPQLNHRGR